MFRGVRMRVGGGRRDRVKEGLNRLLTEPLAGLRNRTRRDRQAPSPRSRERQSNHEILQGTAAKQGHRHGEPGHARQVQLALSCLRRLGRQGRRHLGRRDVSAERVKGTRLGVRPDPGKGGLQRWLHHPRGCTDIAALR